MQYADDKLFDTMMKWWNDDGDDDNDDDDHNDDDGVDDDNDDDDDDGNDVIRCKTGPHICIMVWPDGFQGVSKYDYGWEGSNSINVFSNLTIWSICKIANLVKGVHFAFIKEASLLIWQIRNTKLDPKMELWLLS